MAVIQAIFSILLSIFVAFGGSIIKTGPRPTAPADAIELHYGEGKCEYLSIFLPQNTDGVKNVLFLIHGGAWLAGNESEYYSDCRKAAREMGLVAVTADYDKIQDGATAADEVEEIDKAVKAVKEKLSSLGIETGKMILAGHSAGAHIANLYAYTRYETSAIKIAFVVSNCSPTDFEYDAKTKSTVMGKYAFWAMSALCGKAVIPGTSDKAQRKLIDSINPIKQITPGCPPTIVVQGTNDEMVPYQNAVDLFNGLRAAGVDSALITYEGAGHGLGWHFPEEAQRAAAFSDFYSRYCA